MIEPDGGWVPPSALGPRVVAMGGGHGLSASLAALRQVTDQLTAVVTVADDGGSSGRLRREFACLPPGDLRKALSALCGDDTWGVTWARALQHRFASDGDLDQHAMGNLLIIALWDLLGDHVAGLDWVAQLLGAHGRVLPMALSPLDIVADVRGLDPRDPEGVRQVRGQVEVATTPGEVLGVRLDPPDAPACRDAVAAVGEADWVVLGPGSWFTSVIPHLLIPAQRDALERTDARVLVVLNLAPQPGETEGFTPQTHLDVLTRHAPDLRLHTVLADARHTTDAAALRQAVADLGAELVLADVGAADGSPRHDPKKLAAAYARVLGAT